MADFLTDKPAKLERAFLVGVQTHDMAEGEAAELLLELKELVENLRLKRRRAPSSSTSAAPRPRCSSAAARPQELVDRAKADGADVIVFDEALSPAQQRNWEELSGLAVIDRQEVILEIFSDRAHTREATLQVALARMEYSLPAPDPRLDPSFAPTRQGRDGRRRRNPARAGSPHRARPHHAPESASSTNVVKQRDVQRRKRQRVPIPTCAIVGYTNAGKSTLLNTLTGAEVLAADKLFATLDPTTRQLVLRGNQKLLVTDTVGFIRRLPHGLVEAFKATLEEVVVADFLIHVLDVTNPNFEQHHATTLAVLGELGAADKTIVTVFNKVDAADPAMIRARAQARARRALRQRPDARRPRCARGALHRTDRRSARLDRTARAARTLRRDRAPPRRRPHPERGATGRRRSSPRPFSSDAGRLLRAVCG